MNWRPAFTGAACLALLAGCGTVVEPTPSPTLPHPTVASPAPTPTTSPAPPEETPSVTESPLTETVSFGLRDFDGFPVGRTLGDFAQIYQAHWDGCGPDGPSRFAQEPGPPEDNPWVLWVMPEEFDSPPAEAAIAWFGVEATVAADLSAPLGPEGPHGLRLGNTEIELLEIHPRAHVQSYLAEYYNETYLLYTVQDEDEDATVVYAVRDGVIVDIRWGSPRVAVDWQHQLCSEGDAPFDW